MPNRSITKDLDSTFLNNIKFSGLIRFINTNNDIYYVTGIVEIKQGINNISLNNNTIVGDPDGKWDTIKNFAGQLKTAIFTINNMSDYNIFNVEYDSVDFGNINSGRDSRKNVRPGTKFVYFNIQPKNDLVRCRTEALTCVDGNNTLIIINNTIITITGSEERNTLKNIFDELNN